MDGTISLTKRLVVLIHRSGALVAPLAVAVHLVVLGTVAVDLLHMGLDLPGRQMLTLRGTALAALDLGVLIRIDKDVQRVVVLEG